MTFRLTVLENFWPLANPAHRLVLFHALVEASASHLLTMDEKNYSLIIDALYEAAIQILQRAKTALDPIVPSPAIVHRQNGGGITILGYHANLDVCPDPRYPSPHQMLRAARLEALIVHFGAVYIRQHCRIFIMSENKSLYVLGSEDANIREWLETHPDEPFYLNPNVKWEYPEILRQY